MPLISGRTTFKPSGSRCWPGATSPTPISRGLLRVAIVNQAFARKFNLGETVAGVRQLVPAAFMNEAVCAADATRGILPARWDAGRGFRLDRATVRKGS
jgi:hypothetical protein